MNTKKAIEYLTLTKIESRSYEGKNYDEIINLLQRGKKYEKMWGEVVQSSGSYDEWEYLDLDKLEQKYFPK